MSKKTIDVLFEDPEIPSQKFALISIVGPHMPQQCDVWGLKVRGVTDSLEKAKTLTQKLIRIDNTYDIYTVEVGKFFPLTVEPHELDNVEYQNSQLNELVKTYLENRELANDQWHQRKANLIQDAIREGKSQDELANRPEHPIAVLQRIKHFEQQIKETVDTVDSIKQDLELSKQKYNSYSTEERELAQKELETAINSTLNEVSSSNESSLDDIREQLKNDLTVTESTVDKDLTLIVKDMSDLEDELQELNVFKNGLDKTTSPNMIKRVDDSIKTVEEKIKTLKDKLTNTKQVNDYINSNYTNSEWDYLNKSTPSNSLNLN